MAVRLRLRRMDPYFGTRLGTFRADWYGKHLRAMGEPSLLHVKQAAWRFTWLRTFSKPIAVRIATDGNATATRLSGKGGYDPGVIEVQAHIALDTATVANIATRVDSLGFTSMPSEIRQLGTDGEEWILERNDGSYHMVTRWSPRPVGANAPFRAACLAVLAAAPIDVIDW